MFLHADRDCLRVNRTLSGFADVSSAFFLYLQVLGFELNFVHAMHPVTYQFAFCLYLITVFCFTNR